MARALTAAGRPGNPPESRCASGMGCGGRGRPRHGCGVFPPPGGARRGHPEPLSPAPSGRLRRHFGASACAVSTCGDDGPPPLRRRQLPEALRSVAGAKPRGAVARLERGSGVCGRASPHCGTQICRRHIANLRNLKVSALGHLYWRSVEGARKSGPGRVAWKSASKSGLTVALRAPVLGVLGP